MAAYDQCVEESQPVEEHIACANCGRPPRDDTDWQWWRARSDGINELHLFCGDCDQAEFSPDPAA